MASTKISDLTAAAALAATDNIPVVQSAGSGPVRTTPDAIKTYVETGGTVTASDPILNLTQTWNNVAVPFTSVKVNVTDTASAAASELLALQVGASNKFSIAKSGQVNLEYVTRAANASMLVFGTNSGEALGMTTANGGSALSLSNHSSGVSGVALRASSIDLASNGTFRWTNGSNNALTTLDLVLGRGAAGTLVQRNGAAAQTFQVYATYTDASNYVRASLAATSTAVTLAAETAGTGADDVPVVITPAGTSQIEVGNGVQFTEMTAPAAPAANKVILFAQDNGAGKTQLMALFPSGAAQQVAIEP